MSKSVFIYTLICVVLLALNSCASIIHGSRQKILVNSDPTAARIYLNGTDTKKETPAQIKVRRKSGTQMIKLERAGFETTTYGIKSHFNALVAVDFLFWIFPGVIDVCVGAQHLYDKTVYVPLRAAPLTQPVERVAVNRSKGPYLFTRLSDVDVISNVSTKTNDNRFALIIGNEDYTSFQRDLTSEVNVSFARDDASAFNDYAQKLLGIPERNITLLLDATAAEMRQGMAKMNMISKNSGGRAELFVFYAGHGLPDEVSKEPYLMPVDVSGRFVKLGIPLKEFYSQLTEYPTERTTVFIDACFSG
ncbi:MAG TPA: caspase family protein, partial [Cyclobacteriaceae bacterium]